MENTRDESDTAEKVIASALAPMAAGFEVKSSNRTARVSSVTPPPCNVKSPPAQTTTGEPFDLQHTAAILHPPTERVQTTTASSLHTVVIPCDFESPGGKPTLFSKKPQFNDHAMSNQSTGGTREKEQGGLLAKEKATKASSPIERLPAELLHDICTRLDISDLKAFRGVNKRFSDIGTEHAFSHITVNLLKDSYD
ncbi:uncharacterized protein BDZ99DRAFT_527327 [Mytilinidion resinicola]|uniref:F-box domain-containing protein n=1 Tax=Mytilinidion resinicola TaxID=574789 RepID=A0A6A6Y1S3_9PEZI|nr:uncharacterized protein BDZ99DRAFT_527327 [Mytilinidion resinicola]KAF2802600.1 hypothetical protein BDZ99DRAFT_527327 [Mytilinidion resinicola]